ncbi:restriction endonuclease [Wukongibacter baidiensis]
MDIYLKLVVFIIAVYVTVIIAKIAYRHFLFNRNIELERFKCLFNVYSRRNLYDLTPREFERWTSLLLKELGYENISLTKQTNDSGRDIICEKDGEKYYIECKKFIFKELVRLRKQDKAKYMKVNREMVQKLVGSMVANRVYRGMIITTGEINDTAKEYVKKLPPAYKIELIDGEKLCRMYESIILERFSIPKSVPNISFIKSL